MIKGGVRCNIELLFYGTAVEFLTVLICLIVINPLKHSLTH